MYLHMRNKFRGRAADKFDQNIYIKGLHVGAHQMNNEMDIASQLKQHGTIS